MKKQTLIIDRTGNFTTKASSENQCKEVKYRFYKYEIKIEVGCKLDERGFIIDQLLIDKGIKELFKNFVTSCELMCNETEKMVYALLLEKNVMPIRSEISIMPLEQYQTASFTLVTTY